MWISDREVNDWEKPLRTESNTAMKNGSAGWEFCYALRCEASIMCHVLTCFDITAISLKTKNITRKAMQICTYIYIQIMCIKNQYINMNT